MGLYSVGAALAACFLFASARVWAGPSITLAGLITRDVNTRADALTHNRISQSDCIADDVFHFPLSIQEGTGFALEVWVGEGVDDCTSLTSRVGTAAICLGLNRAAMLASVQTIDIRVQDVAAVDSSMFGPNGQGRGTASACSPAARLSQSKPLTFYFLLLPEGSVSPVSSYVWSTEMDLVAPPPPTAVGAQSRNGSLGVSWTPNGDPDVTGYYLFCDPTVASSSACTSAALVPGQPATTSLL